MCFGLGLGLRIRRSAIRLQWRDCYSSLALLLSQLISMADEVIVHGGIQAVDLSYAKQFLTKHHYGVLATRRKNGELQMSPVTCGLDAEGAPSSAAAKRPTKLTICERSARRALRFHAQFHGEAGASERRR